eukprot:58136-Chlamydomonas_euryale.AAC.1
MSLDACPAACLAACHHGHPHAHHCVSKALNQLEVVASRPLPRPWRAVRRCLRGERSGRRGQCSGSQTAWRKGPTGKCMRLLGGCSPCLAPTNRQPPCRSLALLAFAPTLAASRNLRRRAPGAAREGARRLQHVVRPWCFGARASSQMKEFPSSIASPPLPSVSTSRDRLRACAVAVLLPHSRRRATSAVSSAPWKPPGRGGGGGGSPAAARGAAVAAVGCCCSCTAGRVEAISSDSASFSSAASAADSADVMACKLRRACVHGARERAGGRGKVSEATAAWAFARSAERPASRACRRDGD